MSDKRINSVKTSNHTITPNVNYYGTKTRVEFKGSCLKQDNVTFTHGKVVNIFSIYEISKSINISDYLTIEKCLFGAISLLKMLILISTNILDMGLDLIDMEVFRSWHWIRQECNNFWSRYDFIIED